MLNLTLSEFSAGLWAKREGTEQSMHDLEALGRSLEAIEPFASPEPEAEICCKLKETNNGIKAALGPIHSQWMPIQVSPGEQSGVTIAAAG